MNPPRGIASGSSLIPNSGPLAPELSETPSNHLFEVQAGASFIPTYRPQAQLLFALQPHPNFRAAARFSSDFSRNLLNATVQAGPSISPSDVMRISFLAEGGIGLLRDDRRQVGNLEGEVMRNGVRYYLGATVELDGAISQQIGFYVSVSGLAALNDNLTVSGISLREGVENINPNELLVIISAGISYGAGNRRALVIQDVATPPMSPPAVQENVSQVLETPLPSSRGNDVFTPYRTFRPLLAEVSTEGPIYATGDSTVSQLALDRAGSMLRDMLIGRPDVVARLQRAGAIIGVFGRNETSCDSPYTSPGDPCTFGGLGGVRGRPVALCAEANIMSLPEDRYSRGMPQGENACIHELGHLIMNVGLTEVERSRIRARYAAVRAQRIWNGDFAMENADEFFAEMTQSYFCANPDVSTYLHVHLANCPENLRDHDPETFALLDRVFRHSSDLR